MRKYKVAILGLGAIFDRHLLAIQGNPESFELVGVYDPKKDLMQTKSAELEVKAYSTEDEVYADNEVNCVTILSPSHLHYEQALKAMNKGKHVIIEKPATFLSSELEELIKIAKTNQVIANCILQVRLNPSVEIVKAAISQGILGNIRNVVLIQNWQRPTEYFSDWRGSMSTSGGILREFAIHYLDILQYLVGKPKVKSAQFFKTKFKNADVDDSIYALLDYEKFGGMVQVSIAAEPKNIECSLSINGDNGVIKLGGKSLDEILNADFLSDEHNRAFLEIKNRVMSKEISILANKGACPHHPELYRQIITNPKAFNLSATNNVISIIEEIYQFKK